MELENIYLLGAFGVNTNRELTDLPEKLFVGDWTRQGLKHYCGSVVYCLEYDWRQEETGDLVLLALPDITGVCVKVRVNDRERTIPWNFRQEIPIGSWLREGGNRIEIEVTGSPRNVFGPFHLKEKPENTHDSSFTPSEEEYCSEYAVTPYGVNGSVKILRKKA